METQELSGKAVFLSGGGSGIGAETAQLLGRHGASVMVTDVNESAARAIAQRIEAEGGRAESCKLDVRDANSVEEAVEAAVDAFGRLDGCVNNAGVATPREDIADIPLEEWERQIAINLTGVFNCLQAELRVMRKMSGGSIVNTASIAGQVGVDHRAGYVAAKHGVIGLTRTAALDYATRGIRVNAIAPGYVDTPLLAGRSADERAEIASRHPVNRLAAPAEIAQAILFLLSDRSSFVTGTVFNVDGGYSAR